MLALVLTPRLLQRCGEREKGMKVPIFKLELILAY